MLGAERSLYVNRVAETFELEYHAHDFYEIAYISAGRGYHHWGGRVVPVGRGDVFVLPIGTPHVFRPHSAADKEKLIVSNCIFSENLMRDAAARIDDMDLAEWFEREGGSARDSRFALEPIFQRMNEEQNGRGPGSAGMLYALFLQLLVGLVRLLRPSDAQVAAPARNEGDRIGEAIEYIARHAADDLSIRSLASRCGMSERHFFRLFKARTGMPFLEYVQRARMRMSCELLLATRHKIGTIAEMAGYRDAQSFYQTFKKIVGVTPGEYRKREGEPFART
jgi:AraC family L-rhamnose operon transcriptional activator RhaR